MRKSETQRPVDGLWIAILRAVVRQALMVGTLAFAAGWLPGALTYADACHSGYNNPVVAENCATDSTAWSSQWRADRNRFVYDSRVLAGYASSTSVNRGGTINFYVQSPQSPGGFTIAFYRLGWYGGKGGRLMSTTPKLTSPLQPACRWQNSGTANAYFTCNNWTVSYSLNVPQSWTSGMYMAVIISVATAPAPEPAGMPYSHSVVFAVRDDSRKADFIYQQAVATDQAYNSYYYGMSLYNSQDVSGNRVPVAKASFDRPFDSPDNLQFYRFEIPFIYWLEEQGYDVIYSTDIDTHESRVPLAARVKAFLTAGHSEYWTKAMYDAVARARDAGVHLGFFSGNSLYWQMRLEDEVAPPGDSTHERQDRVMVVFRHPYPPNSAGLGDPNPDPTLQTINWRDFPVSRDEQALVGVHFTHPQVCAEHLAAWASAGRPPAKSPPQEQTAPAVLFEPQPLTVNDDTSWVYQGTGLRRGDQVNHVYGQEADASEQPMTAQICGRSPAEPPPRAPPHRAGTFTVLAQSAFTYELARPGQPTFSAPTRVPVNSVIYQACTGSWVFGAGDIMWADTLAPSPLGPDYSSASLQQVTKNILDVFAGRALAPASRGVCIGSFPLGLAGAIIEATSDQ